VLTSATNLIQLQKHLKGLAKRTFEYRSTKNGTRVVTKDMVDYQAIESFFESKNFSYYTFHPKAEKPIKAVIRHLPINTPAEDIVDGLVDLSFGVISVRKMSTALRSPESFYDHYLAFVPSNTAKDDKVPRTFQTVLTLPYLRQGRGV
jgi:hypothetical protein